MSALAGRIRAIPSWQLTLGVALLLLGFLIAAQLAAEGPRVRYTSQERTPLVETALALQDQQDQLKARIVALRGQIQAIEQDSAGSQAAVRTLNTQLEEARIAAGLIPLTGTGIVLKLEDSDQPVPPGGNEGDYLVGANDLRRVVDELWKAGAEAVAINDERITTSTAIIDIGGSVLVNAAYLAGPVPGQRRSARRSCSPTCRPRPGSRSSSAPGAAPSGSGSRGRSPPPSTSRRSPARST